MADIFLSYSREDKARVTQLVAALEAEGWTVWWDAAIAPGEEFDSLIERELRAAGAVVVVWTPTSVASRWVRGEARFAADRDTLIPVRFDAAELPLDVRALHTTDLDGWQQDRRSDEFRSLVAAIRTRVPARGAGNAPEAATVEPSHQPGIDAAIAALEAQRPQLGDAVVDTALASLRASASAIRTSDPAPASPQLKLLTLLLIDTSAPSAVTNVTHPEELHEAALTLLTRITRLVEQHHGHVLGHTGDTILAVFGDVVADENDAENAVRAGLALIAASLETASGKKREKFIEVRALRAGIDSGLVYLDPASVGTSSVHGSAVNLATRMVLSAPAGSLRISQNTYRLVRGLFEVCEESCAADDDSGQALQTYLVKASKPKVFHAGTRGVDGIETRMVGRDRELSALQTAFASVHAARALQTLTVLADAGVGKSRLLHEFENWAQIQPQAFYVLKGRALVETQQQPYGLLRDILTSRLRIDDRDSAGTARQKLIDGIASTPVAHDLAAVHLLGHLIGLDFSQSPHLRGILGDPQQIRARAFRTAAQWLRGIATNAESGAPIVLLLDDLHWADDGTLDFLSYLVGVNRDTPLLVLASARPQLLERRANWIDESASTTRIELAPLGREQTRELADVLLQKIESVPTELRDMISNGGDGNPFFMEELVNMLIDEGALVPGEAGAWRMVPEKLRALHIPMTLMGVLQARTDTLPRMERIALQQASVIGFVFWDQALGALDSRSPGSLNPLTGRGLTVAQAQSSIADAHEFTFQHHLLRQFTYDSVLKRERRDYHARAAAWFAAFASERGPEYLGITGEHFERAGAIGEAIDYYARAAENAAQRDARKIALDYVARALALASTDDHEVHWRLLATRESLLALQADRTMHLAQLDALDATADTLGDDTKRADAACRRAAYHVSEGEYQKAEVVAQRVLALTEHVDAPIIRARACGQLAMAVRRMGRFAEARLVAEQGLRIARGHGSLATQGELMTALCAILTEQGDYLAGHRLLLEALAIARRTGDKVRETHVLNSLGDGSIRLGDYAAARDFFVESLDKTRQLEWTYYESIGLLNLAAVAHLQGNDESAVTDARAAAALAAKIGARDLEAAAHLPLGLAEAALGHHESARAALDRSRELFELNDGHHLALEPIAGLALLALAEGNQTAALTEVEKILDHLSQGGDLHGTEEPFRIRLSCYEVLQHCGDTRAYALLASARTELQAQAARIPEPDIRDRFLGRVPHHAAIVAAWDRQSGSVAAHLV